MDKNLINNFKKEYRQIQEVNNLYYSSLISLDNYFPYSGKIEEEDIKLKNKGMEELVTYYVNKGGPKITITTQRLDEARKYFLEHPSTEIKDIAKKFGFCSHTISRLLNRYFKKV